MSATIVTTVQVKFDGSTLTDISDRIISASISYGRQRNLDEFGAGTCTIEIMNRDNFLTPGHSDSAQGNTQLIGREVRISAAVTGGSDSYSSYLFRGQIADVDYEPDVNHQSATTILKCVDNFVRLSRATFTGQSFSAEATSVRATNILDLASVDYPDESNPNDRTIATGAVTCLSASGQAGNALDYLQTIARTENGKIFINHAGTPAATNFGGVLTFTAQNQTPLASGLTVSDANSLSAGSIQAEDIKLEYGSELLFNAFSITPASGSIQVGNNAASVAKYGSRTLERTVLSSAADAANAGSYFIGLYDEPNLRVSQVTLQADMATVADAEKILHLNINSALDLSILPVGSSATLVGEYIVEGLSIQITPKDMASNKSSIRYVVSTSAADATGYWILGDPSLSVLPTILGL
tara:strand:- start:529 stop:1764 length:1236 start_codon:yes stop_codon:yes gene_type:complete